MLRAPLAEEEHAGLSAGGSNGAGAIHPHAASSSASHTRSSRRSSQGAQAAAHYAAHSAQHGYHGPAHHSSAHHDAYSTAAPAPATSEQVHEFTAGASSSITVLVRVRPLSTKEIEEDTRSVVKVLGSNVVTMLAPLVAANDYLRAGRVSEKRFAFDSAFGEATEQSTIYNHATKNLIAGVLEGFNATAFAYGATGSGKTFTMSGSASSPGVMVLTLSDLFAQIEAIQSARAYRYQVSLSLTELYNENIRDLLANHSGGGGGGSSDHGLHHDTEPTNNPHTNPNSLDLREDGLKGMVIAGVTEVKGINSSEQILALLERGNRNRTTEATQANAVSSRSHQVLTIHVERHDASPGGSGEIKVGKLNLIDLAGSERASKTQNRGVRLTEGANINRSLLALANVINSLATAADNINYRDSKLTRLLKDSLGGNCKTVMIACVSPAESSYEETLNTLHYADRAKNIKTRQSSNEKTVALKVHEMEAVIRALRNEIQTLKGELWQAHQGQAPLSPPIAAAPQHRLSRIPSISRPGLSLLIPTGPKLLLPELITEEGSALPPNQLAMQRRGGQQQPQGNSVGSPSRLQQPSNFTTLPQLQQQSQQQQQQQQRWAQSQPPAQVSMSSPSHRRSSRKHAHRRRTHSKQPPQQNGAAGAFFPSISSPSAAAAASSPARRAPRQEIDSFLSSPSVDPKALSDALSFLRDSSSAAVTEGSAGAGSVILPAELSPTLDAWPFDLLRRLQSKLWAELLHARSRLVSEALRPELTTRTTMAQKQQQQSSNPDALSSEIEAQQTRLAALQDLGSKLRARCTLKQALADLVFSKLKARIEAARRRQDDGSNGRMPLLPIPSASAPERDDTMPSASQARKSLSADWRSFCAAHNKLLADESDLRAGLSVHSMRAQLSQLETLVSAQDLIISEQLLSRLGEDDPQRAEVGSLVEQTKGVLASVSAAMAARGSAEDDPTVISAQQVRQAIKLQRQPSQLQITDGFTGNGNGHSSAASSHKKNRRSTRRADDAEDAKLFQKDAPSPHNRSQKKHGGHRDRRSTVSDPPQSQLPSPSNQHARSSNGSPTRASAPRANRASLPQGVMLPALTSPSNGAYRPSARVHQQPQ